MLGFREDLVFEGARTIDATSRCANKENRLMARG